MGTDRRRAMGTRQSDERDPRVDHMVALELFYSARNATEFTSLRGELDALPNCPTGIGQWKRALEVYEQLARKGGLHHRAVRHPDLLIAAAAEASGIPVLHYDEDYDRVAEITG